MKPLTIGIVARRAGVGVETVRFYEREGLIARPPKPVSGFRNYGDETVARIRFIRQAQDLGFTLKEVAELLALQVAQDADCGSIRTRAEAKLAAVERRVAELARVRGALERLIAACPNRGAPSDCTILDALANTPELTAGEARGHADSQCSAGSADARIATDAGVTKRSGGPDVACPSDGDHT